MKRIKEIRAWLHRAAHGDEFVYFRGHMMEDRGHPALPALEPLARYAMGMHEMGIVGLVQRRKGPSDYEYIMQAV